MGLSARAAAKELGLSHPALLKAARAGRITLEHDGTYDVDRVRRQLLENSHSEKRKRKKSATEVVTEGGNHPELVTTLVTTPVTAEDLVTTPIPDEDEPATGNRTLAEAHRQREWIRVQKDELDLRRKKGELASIGEVNAFVAGMIILSCAMCCRMLDL
jgi:hypothetical protein